jgi:hypothetical protein
MSIEVFAEMTIFQKSFLKRIDVAETKQKNPVKADVSGEGIHNSILQRPNISLGF